MRLGPRRTRRLGGKPAQEPPQARQMGATGSFFEFDSLPRGLNGPAVGAGSLRLMRIDFRLDQPFQDIARLGTVERYTYGYCTVYGTARYEDGSTYELPAITLDERLPSNIRRLVQEPTLLFDIRQPWREHLFVPPDGGIEHISTIDFRHMAVVEMVHNVIVTDGTAYRTLKSRSGII